MLEQVIQKLEQNASGGTVPASIVEDCIEILGDAEEYRARKAKALLIQQVNSPENTDTLDKEFLHDNEQVPVEHVLGAIRALFQQQDE